MRTVLFSFLILSIFTASSFSAPILPDNINEERFATELLWKSVVKMKEADRPRVLLVLGGGGARGLSHIGVLRVLQEERIPVDEIVGVSVGALIGSLYAAGLPVGQIENMAHEIGWDKLTDISKTTMVKLVLSEELLSTSGMEKYLAAQMGDISFSELKIPFSCIATDIQTGERIVLNEGSVALAARASATIPAIFKPVQFRQRFLVDGGLVDNLPTDIFHSKEDWDVVIGVLPKSDVLVSDASTVFKSMVRAIEIQRDVIVRERRNNADVLIEPNANDIGIADLQRTPELIAAGIHASREKALEIKKLIIKRLLERGKMENESHAR